MGIYNSFDPLAPVPQYIGYWWQSKEDAVASCVFNTRDALRNEQQYVKNRYKKAIKLYDNTECEDLDAWQFMTLIEMDGPNQDNVIESIVDTIHAEILSNEVKAQFITFSGDWDAQQRAKSLTTFISGLFFECKFHENVLPSAILDALVFGDGWIKPYRDYNSKKVKIDRCFPYSITVDDVEAANCQPMQLFESSIISRELLLSDIYNFGKLTSKIEQSIRNAKNHDFKSNKINRHISDMVDVCEAWRIGTEDKPGRHVVVLRDGTPLLDEEYTKDYFPHINLKYKKRTKGPFGKGVPEILEGNAHRINGFGEKIDSQLFMAANFTWSREPLKESFLSNENHKYFTSSEPPQVIVTPAVSPDLLQRYAMVVTEAAERVGVNAVMMKSEMPAGLANGSGKQLRYYADLKSKRFMAFAKSVDNFVINTAQRCIDIIDDDIEESKEAYTVNGQIDGMLEDLDFRDIKLPKNSFVIRPYPANLLSDTPSSRIADIKELTAIYPEEMKPQLASLLNNPDVENISAQLNTQYNSIKKIINDIMRGRIKPTEYPPDGYMDPAIASHCITDAIVFYRSQGAPADRIQSLIDWSNLLVKLIRDQKEQAAAMAPPSSVSPMAPLPMAQPGLPMMQPNDGSPIM